MKVIWKILKFTFGNIKALSIYAITMLILGFLTLFIFDNIVMPSYTGLGNEYPVPDVTG